MARQYLRLLLVLLGLLSLALVACDPAEEDDTEDESQNDMEMESGEDQMPGMAMPETPDDLDTSTSRETDNGVFAVTVSPELDPLAINEIHSWIIHVETPNGEPVEQAAIVVGGGMPEHNHGFPTVPEVTKELGGGDYRIEGVKFNMSGWWELMLTIDADGESDSVTFNLILP